ncbi:hypothetical protein GCM10018785_73140 [Streptomyces longispororuber]|uniref:Uncharacterized protein n=1 Tax=Streptomyces longispororuber TaxID=68230 RepID=A0A919DYJ8_9ACTN|nr:hypothetical protein GCM10018785_73140 [Streptomyces longispororuber]
MAGVAADTRPAVVTAATAPAQRRLLARIESMYRFPPLDALSRTPCPVRAARPQACSAASRVRMSRHKPEREAESVISPLAPAEDGSIQAVAWEHASKAED